MTQHQRATAWTIGGLSAGRALVFFVAIPTVLGLFVGWLQPGRTADWPKSAALLYEVSIYLVSWLLLDLLTQAVARLTRSLQPGLLAVLMIGFVIGQAFIGIVGRAALYLVATLYSGLEQGPPLPEYPWEGGFSVGRLLDDLAPGIFIWFGLNLFLYRALCWPRYGFSARSTFDSRATEPPVHSDQHPIDAPPRRPMNLASRITPALGPVMALKAEEHYVRVYGATTTELVLYRFSDAVAEMASSGAQVHRSWWVADRAVVGARVDGQRPFLQLSNGQMAPVSRSFKRQIATRGWLGDDKQLATSTLAPR